LEEEKKAVPDPVLKAVTGILEAAQAGEANAIILLDQVDMFPTFGFQYFKLKPMVSNRSTTF